MASTLIRNARVLDLSGEMPFRGDVLVQGNRIADVSRAGASSFASTAGARSGGFDGHSTVVDANGATLMPGLVESHSHFTYPDLVRIEQVGEIPPEELLLKSMKNAQTMLEMGFTSLFSAAAALPRLDVVARNAIDAGDFPGPRIRAASPELTPSAGLADVNRQHVDRVSFSLVADGADEFRKVSRQMVREGIDTLKMNPSGDDFVPHAKGQTTVMTEAEIAAVCEVGLAHGVTVAAHARSAQSVKWCLKHGCTIIYHADYADDEALALLEAARERIFVSPALGLAIATMNDAGPWGITREMAVSMGAQSQLDACVATMKKLLRAGVRVLPGGDYGFAWNPIGRNARDLAHFVRLLDMSPMEALMSCCVWGAQIMGLENQIGQVKKGFLADLILVDGDPLSDISVLERKERIVCVMKDGKVERMTAPEARNAGYRHAV